MCGIEVIVEPVDNAVDTATSNGDDDKSDRLGCLLNRRGPDYCQVCSMEILPLNVSIRATVLHVRGTAMQKQPVQLSDDTCFCWNGEAYQMLHDKNSIQTMDLQNDESDTTVVANLLNRGMENSDSHAWVWKQQEGDFDMQNVRYEGMVELFDGVHTDKDMNESIIAPSTRLRAITAAISCIYNGEFAFLLATPHALYYGRDVWGRRSLLTTSTSTRWKLASVATYRHEEWTELPPGRVYELDLSTGRTCSMDLVSLRPSSCSYTEVSLHGLSPPPSGVSQKMWQASFRLQHLLTKAVQRRVHNTKFGVGILFSGGLDSVLLAALSSNVLDKSQSIDLLNVNFGTKPSADRKAALASFQELMRLYPERPWRLICVNVEDWEQVVQYEQHVRQLLLPKHTTMDLNIATALWFASRGEGVNVENQQYYRTSCRVLLVGMGADEQMAGYGRHRTSYQHRGYEGLQQELKRDLERLWERNLGRDDRILADHGKEARFPYLDVGVTNYLASLELSTKCNLELEPGVGDKQILRLVAHRLGLETAGGFVKRAIQFGSRMAHMSDTKRFSSRRKASGEARIRDVVVPKTKKEGSS